ncbi:tetratricopeptide repeat protein [Helicobacter sp. 23-1044]
MKALFLTLILLFSQVFAESSAKFDEDKYILDALDAVDLGEDKRAIEIYETLYKNTQKIEYLKEKIFALMRLKEHKDALDSAETFLKIAPNNLEVLKIKAFLLRDDIDCAIEILQKVAALENSEINNIALANLYIQKNDAKRAREHLLNAYNDKKNESILLFITSIDLQSGEVDSALFREHFGDEIGEGFAQVLLELGANSNALDKLDALFADFYARKSSQTNAKNLAKLYFLQNRFDKIVELENALEADFAIDIYLSKKDYVRAKSIAQRAFDDTKNNHYLGILGIIKFESADDKNAVIPQVTQNLALALKDKSNHIFENYLGYLLIDYEIDIAQGISYVKRALKTDAKNPAYLDSLAWGHFKNGECSKAKAVMDDIPREVIEGEAEIKTHLEMIEKCLTK